MARTCRDCGTCTAPGATRMTMSWMIGTLYLVTGGIAWLVKAMFMRNCPSCKHLLGRHQRRDDGSFKD